MRPRKLVLLTSCQNSTGVMTHELCSYLLTSDLSLLVSNVTDVPLGCKYTLNTHIPMAVSFLFRITFLLGFLKGTLQSKTQYNLIVQ